MAFADRWRGMMLRRPRLALRSGETVERADKANDAGNHASDQR